MSEEGSGSGSGEAEGRSTVHDDIVKRLISFQQELRERDLGMPRIHDVGGAVLEPVSGRREPALVDLTVAEADLAARTAVDELRARIEELERVLTRIDGLIAELRERRPAPDAALEGSLRSIEDALAEAAPQPPGA